VPQSMSDCICFDTISAAGSDAGWGFAGDDQGATVTAGAEAQEAVGGVFFDIAGLGDDAVAVGGTHVLGLGVAGIPTSGEA
jgi:hypothetical protein